MTWLPSTFPRGRESSRPETIQDPFQGEPREPGRATPRIRRTLLAPAVGLEPTTRRLTESKRESRISGTLQKQPDGDARGSEIHRTQPHVAYSVAHSDPQNAEHLAAAIANLTRLLALVDDPAVAADLVRERAALREELAAATGRVAGVVRIARSRP